MSNLVVIAHNAHEMAEAQSNIAAWADGKAAEALAARKEIEESLEVASKSKWSTRGFKSGIKIAQRQHEFYRKIAAASRLGYVIVPNLPVDVFAIRTRKGTPERNQQENAWSTHEQASESPPIGEGRYVSSLPQVCTGSYEDIARDGKPITKTFSWAAAFQDVAFPITAVKPQVIDDTSRAMAHEIFDEIGLAPEGAMRKRHYDPMVLGRVIYKPRRRIVSFLVAWWLSNRDIEI